MKQLMFGHTEQVGSVLAFESCGAEVDEASDRAVLTALQLTGTSKCKDVSSGAC